MTMSRVQSELTVTGTRLVEVGRRYGLGGPWVLRGVDFEVTGGSLIRIEGANGTGKSTLLRVIAGIDAPTEGHVVGRPRTAYVPERFPAQLPFTAVDYLVHLGRIHGLSKADAARGAWAWLERLGADEHATTPMSELSKGSSQKVAVAQALLAEPELLVLDEAWTGLDTEARAELDRAVAERAEAGAAVVFVDHDPWRLLDVVEAAYAVQDGELVERPVGELPDRVALNPAPRRLALEPARVSTLTPVRGWRARGGKPGDTSAEAVAEIEAQGPPDAEPPTDPRIMSLTPTDGDTLRMTVSAAHSDAVLRVLLTADPAWHVLSVAHAAPGTSERTAESAESAEEAASAEDAEAADGAKAAESAEDDAPHPAREGR